MAEGAFGPLQQAEVAGFRLLHELGAGRYSHSWLGEDARSHAVVVKLLRRYAPDAAGVDRFLEEAQRLMDLPELDHPHVARPLSAGVHLARAFFLVYESGGDLTLADELRQRGRVPPARALELCAQVCEGLAAAHRAGVLHLDLKPANVGLRRLRDGTEQAVLLDAVTTHLLTRAGIHDPSPLPIASAAYAAPEQASGSGSDERSDLYAAGVLLFQLVSGRLPVTGTTAEDLLRAHREHAMLRLRDIGRPVHPELEDLVARMMAADPATRPESGDEAAAMMRELATLADAAPVEDDVEPEALPLALTSAPPRIPPPALNPALERAMLGQVSTAPESVPPWAVFVRAQGWWTAAAAALAIVLVAGALVVARVRSRTPDLAPWASATTQLASAADLAPPSRPSKLAQYAASPFAKNFERAQKALWTNRAAGAQTILRDILGKPALSRRDRARATRMMGEAEAKRGNRPKAVQWWRQAFQLYDDPEERAKVARLIQGRP
jgi:hypothetical protein